MTPRNRARDLIEYLAVRTVLKILELLPPVAAKALASTLATLASLLTLRWRRVAYRNLNIALPKIDPVARRQIVNGVYQNLGRILFTLSHTPRLNTDNIHDWIEYEGYGHFQRALRRGKGVLFMTGHLGNWELSATAQSLLHHPMHVIVRSFDNPLIDKLIDGYRTFHGNRTIHKQHYGRSLLRALKNNEAVGVLVDQNTIEHDAIFIDFFGVRASSTTGIVKAAMKTGAAVIPGFALWDDRKGHYLLKFYPPLELTQTGNFEEDLEINTQLCQATIEEAVRNHPDQWLWIHRRWKRRPAGQAELYS